MAPAADSAESAAGATDPLKQTLLDEPVKEAPPAEPPPAIDPASYEVKLPDGMAREDPMIAAFLESAAGVRLDGAAVQAVLDKMAPLVAEQLAAPQQAWKTLNTEWQAAIKADPDYTGDKLPAAVGRISAMLDKFGTVETKEAMRLTGAANNPHIFKLLDKLSAAYAEATPVVSPGNGSVAPPPGQRLAAMYPSARAPAGA